jgi:hypothetical protein
MKTQNRIFFVFFVVALLCIQGCHLFHKARAVQLGGLKGVDPCGLGQLGSNDGSKIPVSSRPKLKSSSADLLSQGQFVFVCESFEEWSGIIYSKDPDIDCGISSLIEKKASYKGKCLQGWVPTSSVLPAAG